MSGKVKWWVDEPRPGRDELCACGRPLHYTNVTVRERVEDLIKTLGPNVPVKVGDRVWMVPRHYIALHGLKGAEVASFGFPEVTEWTERKARMHRSE